MTLVSVRDALETVLQSLKPLAAEPVPLARAHARVLADDLRATFSQPPFDGSAMDGYALASADGIAGRSLAIVGTSAAGAAWNEKIGSGQCTRIYTGAPMPPGADTVVMQEHVTGDGNSITLRKTVSKNQHIRFQGADFKTGDRLAVSGTRLSPFHLTLAAAAGFESLNVHRHPRVTIITTGDELVAPGTPLAEGRIIASTSFGLSPLLAAYGARVTDGGIVSDDPEKLRQTLSQALASAPDILITTGGASVGDRDYVKSVLADCGVNPAFRKVAMRPGKPVMFGRRGSSLVFGLPGNPVSALATAIVFVVPAIKALQNLPPHHETTCFPLATNLNPNADREFYHRGKLVRDDDGCILVAAGRTADSAHLTSLADCDCLVRQKPHCDGRQTGDLADVILLPWSGMTDLCGAEYNDMK